jgi:membrane fusion protein, multidrug efflux system
LKPRERSADARWLYSLLLVFFIIAAAWLIWYVAGHWNRWIGAARFETTTDAYIAGDVTPLAAHVSGYITKVAVSDYGAVHQDDLIAEIDPSDYQAQLALAKANLLASQAALANIANQKDVQNALIRQARANIEASDADVDRYQRE